MSPARQAAALPGRLFSAVKRAFGEFLALPVLVVAVFVVPDGSMVAALDALELIGLVASESIQSQTMSSVLRSVAMLLPFASAETTAALAALVRRSLSALGEHGPARELMSALEMLERALTTAGQGGCAEDVGAARRDFALCIGRLNSRSTRVPGTKQT